MPMGDVGGSIEYISGPYDPWLDPVVRHFVPFLDHHKYFRLVREVSYNYKPRNLAGK